MFEIKNTNIKENFDNAAAALGLVAMTAAITMSTFDFGHKPDSRIVLPNQPALATVDNHDNNDPVRREREETAPHHISYNETQRTPSRSGRQ